MKRLLFALIGLLFLAACAKVLGIRPPEPKPFEHHVHLEKGVSCNDCHVGISTAGENAPMHLPDAAACVKCHAKPHDTRECKGCHGLEYVRQGAQLAIDTLKFSHQNHIKRAKGQCVHCHQGVQRDSDQIRPPMALCLSCHEHQNDFAIRTCDRCHKDLKGEHVRPSSHVIHEGDWLREHGTRAAASRDLCSTCHTDTSCAACHGRSVPILPEKMHFDDPLRVGVHRAGFKSRHSLEARTQPGLCSTCHTPQTCDSCHADRGVKATMGAPGSRSPHPPGWVGLRGEGNEHGRQAWRDPAVCASCHSGAGEQLCVGCHRVGGVGGSPHRPGWTSKMRKTVDQPCRQCHGGAQ